MPGVPPNPAPARTSPAAEALRLTAVAFQFLTRLPVPAIRVADGDLRRASAAFPLVGVGIAGIGIAVRAGSAPLWGLLVATIAATAAEVAATGAFHEDGLGDVVDGIWGGWDPAQRIEIMRDSRLGTYGLIGLVTVLGLRVALLAPLDLAWFARATLTGHVLGRASILVMVRLLPAASDQGHGAKVTQPVGPLGTAVAAGTTVVVCLVALGAWAWVPFAAALVPIAATRRLYRRRLGGLTGDCLGATNQLVHLAVLAAVALVVTNGA